MTFSSIGVGYSFNSDRCFDFCAAGNETLLFGTETHGGACRIHRDIPAIIPNIRVRPIYSEDSFILRSILLISPLTPLPLGRRFPFLQLVSTREWAPSLLFFTRKRPLF